MKAPDEEASTADERIDPFKLWPKVVGEQHPCQNPTKTLMVIGGVSKVLEWMSTCPGSDCSNHKVNWALIKGLDVRIVAVAALTKRLYSSLKVDRGKIRKGARREGDTGETFTARIDFPSSRTHPLRWGRNFSLKKYIWGLASTRFSQVLPPPSLHFHPFTFELGFKPICVCSGAAQNR